MDLLDVFSDNVECKFRNYLEALELGLKEDQSGFVFVDGEEGDYGNICYYDSRGGLVAIKIIEGGDYQHVEITAYGREFIKTKLKEVFIKTLDEVF